MSTPSPQQRRTLAGLGGGFAFFILFALPFAGKTFAATVPSCQFDAQFEQISQIQNNQKLDEQQAILAELAIRKGILIGITDCGIRELENLQINLASVALQDAELKRVKNFLHQQIENSIEHYGTQKTKVNDLGIQGTKNLARSLREWRNGNHIPLASRIINFLLWNKNQDIIKASEERFGQITQTIRTLKLENETANAFLGKAEDDLEAARNANRTARTIFTENRDDDAAEPMRASLESLSRMYQNFFDLSESVNSTP